MNGVLYDIKPLETIPDHSLISVGFVVIFLVVTVIAGVIFWRLRINRHHRNDETVLHKIDLDDARIAAYRLTRIGRSYCTTPHALEAYVRMCHELERYKYYPKAPPFDAIARQAIQAFFDEVSHV